MELSAISDGRGHEVAQHDTPVVMSRRKQSVICGCIMCPNSQEPFYPSDKDMLLLNCLLLPSKSASFNTLDKHQSAVNIPDELSSSLASVSVTSIVTICIPSTCETIFVVRMLQPTKSIVIVMFSISSVEVCPAGLGESLCSSAASFEPKVPKARTNTA